MTKDELQVLRDTVTAAKEAYIRFNPDGTVDRDIQERVLLNKCIKATIAYENALNKFMTA